MLFSLVDVTLGFHKENLLEKFSREFFEGEKVFLAGKNGAGKSTFLKALAGQISFRSGKFNRNRFQREIIGYFSQQSQLYEMLSVVENFQFFSSLYKNNFPGVSLKLDQIGKHLEKWGLQKKRDEQVIFLSEGQKARLSLAILFAFPFKYLVLDEPFAALDEDAAQLLIDAISDNKNEFLIVTSHDHAITKGLGITSVINLDREGNKSIKGLSVGEVIR